MRSVTGKFVWITLVFLLTGLDAFSGGGKSFKWGKVSDAEVSLKKVPYDPEAHAVVLAKTGNLSYFNQNFKIQIYYRIKILDSEGISEGNITIPYYSGDRLEKIEQVKAQTLEIQEDGTVISHKLDKDQIFDTPISDYYSEVRFAMPAVKPGTIIEYSYTLITGNFTFLEGWTFQDHIPTLYSYYSVAIPHHLTYNTLMQGSRIYRKYYNETATNEWELENLPAMKEEAYTFNLRDYSEKVQFQLHSYKTTDYRGIINEKEVFQGWEDITKEILTSTEFWDYRHSSGQLKEILAKIPASADRLKYARDIYYYVQNGFTWNEYYGLFPDKELKILLKEKSGNGAAINLLLVNLLGEAGFEANPAYLSTKNHGKVNPNLAMLNKFNHLNAFVTIGDKTYLLDAAGNPMAFGILPVQDLNERALILSKGSPVWTDIKDLSKSYTLISYKADIPNGKHTFDCTWRGFKALEVAEDLEHKRYEKFLMLKDFDIPEDLVKISNSIGTENSLKADIIFSGNSNWTADKIYYDLPLPESLKDNPFKNEIRIFPVDFGYAYTTHLVYEIKLPENYSLQEKPEDILMKLPDGSASFIFQTTHTDRLLNIQVKMDIKKPFIPQESYPDLREFFSKMLNHCSQPYVLVKVQ